MQNQRLRKPQAMMFDMDGTLFETETVLLPAYHRTFEQLRHEGLYEGDTPPEQIILGSLGMLLEDIWARVLPGASRQTVERANELLLEFQLETMQTGVSRLYPHVETTLQALHAQGVRLFIASNGLERYVKCITDVHHLDRWLEGVYSAGEYATATKTELVRLLMTQHRLQSAWMIGDRSSDVEAGKGNGQTVIGCRYADFGDEQELDGADAIIVSFEQLLDVFNRAE